MANRYEYGFRWNRAYNGGKSCPAPEELQIASGYQASINGGGNVDLNIGDVVRRLADGTGELADGSEGASGGEDMLGVIVGFKPYRDATIGSNGALKPTNRLPGGTTYTNDEDRSIALIVPVTAGIWSAQCDDKVTATTRAAYQALINENVDHINTEPGNSKAGPQLDISGHIAGTAQWRIWGIDLTVSNQDFSDDYVTLLVVANEVQIAPFVTAGL